MTNQSTKKEWRDSRLCSQCKTDKPLSDFFKKPGGKYGRSSFCKDCYKKYDTKRYYEHREQMLKESKERYEKDKERILARQKLYSQKHLLKAKARQTTRNAIFKGLIVRKPCEICGNPKSQVHHDDYSKPLEVKFLCKDCHAKHHRTRKDINLRQDYVRDKFICLNNYEN